VRREDEGERGERWARREDWEGQGEKRAGTRREICETGQREARRCNHAMRVRVGEARDEVRGRVQTHNRDVSLSWRTYFAADSGLGCQY
jgi:hypothetical protein